MRKTFLFLSIIVVLAFSLGVFAFQSEPDGFRGLKWGETPHWRYMEIGETGSSGGYYYTKYPIGYEEVTWCTWKNDKLYIGPAELGSIRYVFYRSEFMEVQIWVKYGGFDDLKSVLILKFGEPQEIQSKPFRHAEYGETERVTYVWIGEKAGIEFEVLLKWYGYGRDRYLSYAPKPGLLRIYSVEISNEFEKVMKRKREEAYRKREQAIIEGLDDFSRPKEEQKELDIEEQMRKIVLQEKEEAEREKESDIEGPIGGRGVVRWVQPGFPRSAEDLGMRDGKVRVKIWVLSSGEVVETAIIQTSNVPEFDQDAAEALRKCRFEEIEAEEKQWGIVTFRFEAE